MLYNIVLVFAIHQHESVTGIHMPSPSWTFLPPHPSPLNLPFFMKIVPCDLKLQNTSYLTFKVGEFALSWGIFMGLKKDASKILVSKIHIWEEKGKCVRMICEKKYHKTSSTQFPIVSMSNHRYSIT